MRITISSGHGLHVPGARGLIDEVTEARRVTNRVGEILRAANVPVWVFHDDTSRNQRDNVNHIVAQHNAQQRTLDVSIHFNAVAVTRDAGIGVEVLHHLSSAVGRNMAERVARAISQASGLILRHPQRGGAVPRSDIGFLNNTREPAILVEVCFVNSRTDVRLYQESFEQICRAIAHEISERRVPMNPTQTTPPMTPAAPPQPSDWAREAWEWGTANGITDGTNPQGAPTREQVVQLLYNFYKNHVA